MSAQNTNHTFSQWATLLVCICVFGVLMGRRPEAHSPEIRAVIAGVAFAIFVVGIGVFHYRKTEPNQAPEPTSTAVTPPAVAGDRASGTRGSSERWADET